MKKSNIILGISLNLFIIAYGIIISMYIGNIVFVRDKESIKINSEPEIEHQYITSKLEKKAYALFFYTSNEIQNEVLDSIEIKMEHETSFTKPEIKYERIFSGTGSEYYSQLATVKITQEGKYTLNITIGSVQVVNNPKIVIKEGYDVENFIVTYISYILVVIIVNVLYFINRKLEKERRKVVCQNCNELLEKKDEYCSECGYERKRIKGSI
jgi:hypothetical protein